MQLTGTPTMGSAATIPSAMCATGRMAWAALMHLPSSIQSENLDYYDFAEVVMSGRERKLADGSTSIMPAFGDNKNVSCYGEDIFAYLLARADGAIERGRPRKRDAKPEGAKETESACH